MLVGSFKSWSVITEITRKSLDVPPIATRKEQSPTVVQLATFPKNIRIKCNYCLPGTSNAISHENHEILWQVCVALVALVSDPRKCHYLIIYGPFMVECGKFVSNLGDSKNTNCLHGTIYQIQFPTTSMCSRVVLDKAIYILCHAVLTVEMGYFSKCCFWVLENSCRASIIFPQISLCPSIQAITVISRLPRSSV